jgi:hypothetical protein
MEKYIRQLLTEYVNIEEVQIGRQNFINEIDETKLGKRKNHRAHKVEGV